MPRAIRILLVVAFMMNLLAPVSNSVAASSEAELTAEEKAQSLIENMTPEEKVGQLFLVTFQGTNTDTESAIYNLISKQHIGGIVLRSDNDNFTAAQETVPGTQEMIKALQTVNWETTQALSLEDTAQNANSYNYIPLLVGISQEGDLSPYDQIINGLTPLPNEMAIGATWKTSNAETVGTILGQELHALGINLIFGPSLDVLDNVNTESGDDLGTRTFGGDPYWVAEMGKAYIKGIHLGSENQISVIATHFPGSGGSDRQPEDEVATVRKSLEQLKQIELAPFFAVTQQNEDTQEVTDGLMLSHIRYQGFQGNIRATTRPVSFDSTAFEQIMSLSDFSTWRENGGIIVSDDLGSAAVRKFFDPTNSSFDARQVMKSALLAGNDLLYTGNIIASGDEDTYTTIVRTHEYFVQKYLEDSAFQQRVDEAVLRILTLKFKLYPNFRLTEVLPKTTDLEVIGTSQQQIFEIARQSVTLISPDLTDLDAVLQEPPQIEDRIVFISNKIPQQQCSTCADQSIFLADNLQSAVERLYGPMAGEQIQSIKLSSYSFDELELLLNNGEAPENLLSDLQTADWIVISFTEFQASSTESNLFQRFFSERPELLSNKKIIGFAFNAPYYPDATDISKFTAYYAIYSKIPMFVEVAARILFQEITPTGVLPVSMTSIGYDLITATSPDPDQIIPLMVEVPIDNLELNQTPESKTETSLIYNVGDTLPLQTGIIKDNNGNPVPDGTIVRFLIDTHSASGSTEQIETQTVDGVARTTYRIQNTGLIELTVIADPAEVSQILSLDITNAGGILTSIEPTFSPTDESEGTESAEVAATPEANNLTNHQIGIPSFSDWLLTTFIVFAIVFTLYWWGLRRQLRFWNPRLPFLSGLFGYLVYLYIVIGLPGTEDMIQTGGSGLLVLYVLGGCCFGGILGFLLFRMELIKKR